MASTVHCEAVIGSTICTKPPVDVRYRPWCEEHAKQERVLYHFLKQTEKLWESLERMAVDTEIAEGKEESLTFLTHVIVARKAQGDWFFPASKCPGHLEHERDLAGKRGSVMRTLYLMRIAICTKIPDNLLQETLERLLQTISITQPLDVLTGNAAETPEEFLIVKQEAAELLWNKLQGLQVVKLLNLRTGPIPDMRDERYIYQPEISITQRESVDWNEVPAAFGANNWLEQERGDYHEHESQHKMPSTGWLARGIRRLLMFLLGWVISIFSNCYRGSK
ncbi:hypothetical protein PG995_010430 [Apiospora arundinis]